MSARLRSASSRFLKMSRTMSKYRGSNRPDRESKMVSARQRCLRAHSWPWRRIEEVGGPLTAWQLIGRMQTAVATDLDVAWAVSNLTLFDQLDLTLDLLVSRERTTNESYQR